VNILYVSSTCSREKYTQYVESKGARVSQQAQKYNLLLAEGMVANGAKVRLISTRPINRYVEKRLWMKGERESVNGIDFCYVPFINYPVFRNLWVLLGVFFKTLFSPCSKRDTAVVCDALNIVASMAAQAAAALRGYKTVGIVTDVPGHFSYAQKVTFTQKLNLGVMRRFKSYLLLTAPMNQIVNPKNRPYIVLEGHADTQMEQVENAPENKSKARACLYAGSLMKIYGIANLVEGFVQANVPGTELHIYGDGDFASELKLLAQQHANIKFFGVAPNSRIVQAELAATLLVNPRPTNEDYTKYSFPSKNMEYMASGTPVLTTKLPGMPEEYYPYVYLLEDETAEGMAKALREILSKPAEELAQKGADAKRFVMEKKNNISQAKKLLDMLENIVPGVGKE